MFANSLNHKIGSTMLGILFFGMSAPLFASDAITISSKIPYLSDKVGNAAIRSECTWNSTMPTNLAAKSKGSVVTTDQDINTVQGKKLIITAVNIHAAGGYRFSGPKWITLKGELIENGKLLGSFELRRTTGGKLRVCQTLDHIGEALTQDVLVWLKNPTIMATPVVDEKVKEAAKG